MVAQHETLLRGQSGRGVQMGKESVTAILLEACGLRLEKALEGTRLNTRLDAPPLSSLLFLLRLDSEMTAV